MTWEYGPLPSRVRARILRSEAEDLLRMAERLMEAAQGLLVLELQNLAREMCFRADLLDPPYAEPDYEISG